MTEKEIERILVTGVRDLGGRAYKWVSPGNAGVPDRIVIFPGQAPIFADQVAGGSDPPAAGSAAEGSGPAWGEGSTDVPLAGFRKGL